jgi:hypothetical protein
MNKGVQRNSLQNFKGTKFCKNSIKKGYQKATFTTVQSSIIL